MKKRVGVVCVVVSLLALTFGVAAQESQAWIPGVASLALPGLGQFLNDPFKLRTALGELRGLLAKQKCTSIFVCETDGNAVSRYGVEENVLDGVIQTMLVEEKNNLIHAIAVRDMKSTEFNMQMHPFELTKHGLSVHKIPIVD